MNATVQVWPSMRARTVVGFVLARPAMLVAGQALIAAVLVVAGVSGAWRIAADWWLATLTVVNVICIGWLSRVMRREGRGFFSLFKPPGANWKRDLPIALGVLVLSGPIGFLPNLGLGKLLWGDAAVGAALSQRPILPWAAWALLAVFPVSQGLAELPVYFGYTLPRLQAATTRRWLPLLFCAGVLSTQHVFLPLLFDWRFAVWRLLMFAPFALWLGFALDRRPGLLPYLAVAHGLLDASLPVFLVVHSTGSN